MDRVEKGQQKTSDSGVADDLAERLQARFSGLPIFQLLPFRIEAIELDRAQLFMDFRPELDNGGGAIQGGLLAGVADVAIACALATNFDGKMGFATSSLNIHFLRRAKSAVRVDARIIKKGATICVAHVEICDASDRLVAVVTSDFVLTTSKLPAEKQ